MPFMLRYFCTSVLIEAIWCLLLEYHQARSTTPNYAASRTTIPYTKREAAASSSLMANRDRWSPSSIAFPASTRAAGAGRTPAFCSRVRPCSRSDSLGMVSASLLIHRFIGHPIGMNFLVSWHNSKPQQSPPEKITQTRWLLAFCT